MNTITAISLVHSLCVPAKKALIVHQFIHKTDGPRDDVDDAGDNILEVNMSK